ncbi:MAG: aminotransferase class I/II-fold pyridoxal phosphate-dependent enzyme [Alphaproteobacteria bacterium]|nr:aminotransferase class I/II-fold pyridoxal phosphate-dependent enzyme [Alphaproteobacteria bacterium]
MAIKVATRGRIAPFVVMEVMRAANARAAAGYDVIHLEVGQPSTGAPDQVIAAAKRSIDVAELGYTEALGLFELRERIAAFYRTRYGTEVSPQRIAVTTGSSGGFVLAFLGAFDAGDRIAFAAPSYPGYRNIATALDLLPMAIPCNEASGFQPDVELLDRLDPVPDGLILASPANPTGAMIAPDVLGEIVAWCKARSVRVLSDEIYHGITYGRAAETLLGQDPTAVVINSFSKYFSMTGWRLGWLVLPDDLSRAVECLTQNLFISPPTLSQHAAMEVFDCLDALDENVRRYADNRAILLDGLPRCGFGPLAPADGAFYVYGGVGSLGGDSPRLCAEILQEAGVAVTPGTDFDPDHGHEFIRFSYAGATAEMTEAISRLRRWAEHR